MNPYDQFDQAASGNPYDQFDAKPKPMGQAANADFLREELKAADPFTRNLAAAGTALSDWWERGKQLVGKGDQEAIALNRVIADEAPIGRLIGDVATTAVPFGLAANTVKAGVGVGAALGFARPVEGEQTFENIARGTAKNVSVDAALGGVGAKIANKAGDWFAGLEADFARRKAQNAVRDATLTEGQAAGLKVPPASVDPNWWNTFKERVGGKVATAQTAANQNAGEFGAMARRDLGLAPDAPLSEASLKAVRNEAGKAYEEVKRMPGRVQIDDVFINDVDTIGREFAQAAKEFPEIAGSPAITQLQNALLKQNDVGSAATALELTKKLRADGRKNMKAFDDNAKVALGKAQREAADSIEALIERTYEPLKPDLIANMRAARKRIAMAHDVEGALNTGSGTVDARKLSDRASGELNVARRFAEAFPKASQPPSQIAGPAVNKLTTFLLPAAGGVTGASFGGSEGGALGTAVGLFGPAAMRAQMLSKMAQRNVLRDAYELSRPHRATRNVLKRAPVVLTVGGSPALLE